MSLSIESYIPEVGGWVEEASIKSGEKPYHIKQNLHGDRQPSFYYQLRCFPRSAVIERIYVGEVVRIGTKNYGAVKNKEPELIANLKRGQEEIEIPIKTDFDTTPHRYRFTYREKASA